MKIQTKKLEEKMGFLPVYGSQSELSRAQGQEIEDQSKNSQPYLAPPLFLLIYAILNLILLNWVSCCEPAERGRGLNRSACESWHFLGQFLATFESMGQKNVHFWPIYFQKMAIFSSKKGGQIWTTLSQFLANLQQKNVIFWPIIFQAKKEANFEQLWVNFWPILE